MKKILALIGLLTLIAAGCEYKYTPNEIYRMCVESKIANHQDMDECNKIDLSKLDTSKQ